MERFLACPESNPNCNDTSATSAVLVLFPLAVLLAFGVAASVQRFAPAHRVIGGTLAVIGAIAFVLYSSSPLVVVAWLIMVVGFVLLRGGRISAR